MEGEDIKRLFQYLGKYSFWIVLIFALLVLQANCDLSLPQYISDIVNVGIQQSGIESPIPTEIRETSLEKLELFMSDADRALVEASFAPGADGVYTYAGADDPAALEQAMTVPMVINLYLGTTATGSESAQMQAGLLQSLGLPALPAGTSLVDAIAAMPPEEQQAAVAAVLEVFQEYADLGDSLLRQGAVAYVQAEYQALGIDLEAIQSDYIWITGLKMLGLAAVIALASILVSFLAAHISAGYSKDIRSALVRKALTFSTAEFDQVPIASLITRCTNDIQQIQMLVVMVLRMVLYAPVLGIGAIFKVMGTASSLTWIIGAAIGVILCIVIVLLIVALPRFNRLQSLVDRLNLVTREILNGLPVIRAFGREDYEKKRFDKASRELMGTQLFVNRVMAVLMPALMLIMNGISVLIIWVGADAIGQGQMQVGDLMAFIQYTIQIIVAFVMLSAMSVLLPRAMISMSRVGQILDQKQTIVDPPQPKAFPEGTKGVVEFRDVSYRYPGAKEDALRHISFTAQPGTTTAIIGSTGCGKTTLLNLILRFADVTGGAVLVDGMDVREVALADLRSRLGYVPQRGMLFSGTIGENIAYGGGADQVQVEKAAAIAQAADFIGEKPEGYESPIAQGGSNVSGGQRQRLSIARALARQPEILLFDDSFSALDFKTDAALRRAIAREVTEATIFIVAQRISTVLNAQQILVLDEGQLVGVGTHKELMQSCAVYQQIASSQLSREELGA